MPTSLSLRGNSAAQDRSALVLVVALTLACTDTAAAVRTAAPTPSATPAPAPTAEGALAVSCELDPSTITATGFSTSIATVSITDAKGAPVTRGVLDVTLSKTSGNATVLMTARPQNPSNGLTQFTVRSLASGITGVDKYVPAITMINGVATTAPGSPCFVSVQSSVGLPAPAAPPAPVRHLERSPGCSATQITPIPAAIPSPRGHFFAECDETDFITWDYWIGLSETTSSQPSGSWDQELRAHGFAVLCICELSTPRPWAFAGHGLTGEFWSVPEDAPVEAVGQRAVVLFGISVDRQPPPSARPVGFALPSGCTYTATFMVTTARPSTRRTLWGIECGGQSPEAVRREFEDAFAAQEWTACGAIWVKGGHAMSAPGPGLMALGDSPRESISCP